MPKNRSAAPTIAITMGDPAGVGPEVIVKALADPEVARLASWTVVGNSEVLARARARTATAISPETDARILETGDPKVFEQPLGKVNSVCGQAAVDYVEAATHLCLRGAADAVVTAPLNKEAVAATGRVFSGHTEFIAELCGVTESRMLLTNDRLRVAHVSTHVSLRRACELEPNRILRTIELGHEAVRSMGFAKPRVAVCGLNPHAGENGLFGEEDSRAIRPAVEAARSKGVLCDGPVAADTVFYKAVAGDYDLVIAMYHDQGHIPMKLLDFENTVNVSLGLPIIRASVDHGTAFDIAEQYVANPQNMKAALRLAVTMASHRPERDAREDRQPGGKGRL